MAGPRRPLHLNAVIYGLGSHEAAWRMPESDPLASTDLDFWIDLARRAEAAGFDALFLGDVLALQQGADRHLSDAMDPFVILSALAAVTSRIGLIGTASTSFEHPYHLARRSQSWLAASFKKGRLMIGLGQSRRDADLSNVRFCLFTAQSGQAASGQIRRSQRPVPPTADTAPVAERGGPCSLGWFVRPARG